MFQFTQTPIIEQKPFILDSNLLMKLISLEGLAVNASSLDILLFPFLSHNYLYSGADLINTEIDSKALSSPSKLKNKRREKRLTCLKSNYVLHPLNLLLNHVYSRRNYDKTFLLFC